MVRKILCSIGFHKWCYRNSVDRYCLKCNTNEKEFGIRWRRVETPSEEKTIIAELYHKLLSENTRDILEGCEKVSLSHGSYKINKDGTYLVMPEDIVKLWRYIANTKYNDLKEDEKESIENIIRKFLVKKTI